MIHSLRALFSCAAILLIGACASHTSIPAPQASWSQATGQIQTSGGAVPIVGEIAVRYDAENFLAEITKGPGLPLLKIYGKGPHAEQVTVQGALARGGWSGSPADAPVALQAWVALPEVFHWARAQLDRMPYSIELQGVKTGAHRAGKDLTLLEYTRGGEKIICHLQH
jgi:hypothetical protein